MRTRSIGSLDVSVVGVGCNNLGRELDAKATNEVVSAAIDAGVCFFDTGDTYGVPRSISETYLGQAFRNRRDRVVIATKFGRPIDGARRGAKASYVRFATEASLQRLGTDYIDLLQLAIPDPTTPIEETLGALGDLKKEGKIREIGGGGSNFTAKELHEMSDAARVHATPSFVSTQLEFSVLDQTRSETIAECERTGIKLLPNRPLFHGLLTGKYKQGAPIPAGSRVSSRSANEQDEILKAVNFAKVAALTRYATERGHTLLELAFGWLLAHPLVPTVFAGVSSPAQVAANAAAATGWELSAAERTEIDHLLQSLTSQAAA